MKDKLTADDIITAYKDIMQKPIFVMAYLSRTMFDSLPKAENESVRQAIGGLQVHVSDYLPEGSWGLKDSDGALWWWNGEELVKIPGWGAALSWFK